MNAVLAINGEDLTVTARPASQAAQRGDSSRDCSPDRPRRRDARIGGMAATGRRARPRCATAPCAKRPGAHRRSGRQRHPPGASRKRARRLRPHPPDLARGHARRDHRGHAEAVPHPEAISARDLSFPSVDAAVQTTITTIQLGVPIARCELLDALTVKAVNQRDRLGLPRIPLLLFEFHGSPASVEDGADVEAITPEQADRRLKWAAKPEDHARDYGKRRTPTSRACKSSPAAAASRPDVCVPISRLAVRRRDHRRHRGELPACSDPRPCRRRQSPLRNTCERRRPARSEPRLDPVAQRADVDPIGTCTRAA